MEILVSSLEGGAIKFKSSCLVLGAVFPGVFLHSSDWFPLTTEDPASCLLASDLDGTQWYALSTRRICECL